jgi:hypothetical protein
MMSIQQGDIYAMETFRQSQARFATWIYLSHLVGVTLAIVLSSIVCKTSSSFLTTANSSSRFLTAAEMPLQAVAATTVTC